MGAAGTRAIMYSSLTPPEHPKNHRHHPAAHGRLAYPLYGLTEEEIAIVEGAAWRSGSGGFIT